MINENFLTTFRSTLTENQLDAFDAVTRVLNEAMGTDAILNELLGQVELFATKKDIEVGGQLLEMIFRSIEVGVLLGQTILRDVPPATPDHMSSSMLSLLAGAVKAPAAKIEEA